MSTSGPQDPRTPTGEDVDDEVVTASLLPELKTESDAASDMAGKKKEELAALERVQQLILKVPDFGKRQVNLLPDGSNYNTWFDDLEDAVEGLLRKPFIFSSNKTTLNNDDQSVIRYLIKATVSETLWQQVRRKDDVRAIVASIAARFQKFNRAAHLSLWRELLSLRYDVDSDVPFDAHCAKLSQLATSLQRSGFSFDVDSVLGVLLQLSLPSSTVSGPFMHLNRVLDNLTTRAPSDSQPTSLSYDEVADLAAAELANFRLDGTAQETGFRVAAVKTSSSGPYRSASQPYQSQPVCYKTLEDSEAPQCFWCLDFGHWESNCVAKASGRPRSARPAGKLFQRVGNDKKEWQLLDTGGSSSSQPTSTMSPVRRGMQDPTSAYNRPGSKSNPFQSSASRPSGAPASRSVRINAVHVDDDSGADSNITSDLLWDGAITLDNAATESQTRDD